MLIAPPFGVVLYATWPMRRRGPVLSGVVSGLVVVFVAALAGFLPASVTCTFDGDLVPRCVESGAEDAVPVEAPGTDERAGQWVCPAVDDQLRRVA
ncbi:hypothetical protein [Actinophytocola oryzae]|uniref:hypothetical protein n=1 Tax=Actinophytocola oryzae TaxID=502181 RepID=UPI001062598C|nr:hypothetical protein [Actinophytocola oryzae]